MITPGWEHALCRAGRLAHSCRIRENDHCTCRSFAVPVHTQGSQGRPNVDRATHRPFPSSFRLAQIDLSSAAAWTHRSLSADGGRTSSGPVRPFRRPRALFRRIDQYARWLRAYPEGAPRGLSQRHRLPQDAVPDTRLDAALAHHIHLDAKDLPQFHPERRMIQETSARLHLYEKIEIADFVRLPARDGAEDAHIARAVFRGDAQNVLPFLPQDAINPHTPAPPGRPGWLGRSRRSRFAVDGCIPSPISHPFLSLPAFQNLQFRILFHLADHGVHACHNVIIEQVLAASLALQDGQLLDDHDRLPSQLEGEVREDRVHFSTAHVALHVLLLVFRAASQWSGSG